MGAKEDLMVGRVPDKLIFKVDQKNKALKRRKDFTKYFEDVEWYVVVACRQLPGKCPLASGHNMLHGVQEVGGEDGRVLPLVPSTGEGKSLAAPLPGP